MKVLVKLLYLYKSDSYDDIYLSLHCFFDSLRLIYNYNFLTFIQSHNIYSWHNKRWNYASPMPSGCHFLGVYTSNPFVNNLISASTYTHFSQKNYLQKHRSFSSPDLSTFIKFLIFISTLSRI